MKERGREERGEKDEVVTHLTKERLPLSPQGKAHPADSFNRTQEYFKSKTDYRENQNRIDSFRELGYPEKTILRNSEQLRL